VVAWRARSLFHLVAALVDAVRSLRAGVKGSSSTTSWCPTATWARTRRGRGEARFYVAMTRASTNWCWEPSRGGARSCQAWRGLADGRARALPSLIFSGAGDRDFTATVSRHRGVGLQRQEAHPSGRDDAALRVGHGGLPTCVRRPRVIGRAVAAASPRAPRG